MGSRGMLEGVDEAGICGGVIGIGLAICDNGGGAVWGGWPCGGLNIDSAARVELGWVEGQHEQREGLRLWSTCLQ